MSRELERGDRSNQGEPKPATPGNPDPNTTLPNYTDVPGSNVQGSQPE